MAKPRKTTAKEVLALPQGMIRSRAISLFIANTTQLRTLLFEAMALPSAALMPMFDDLLVGARASDHGFKTVKDFASLCSCILRDALDGNDALGIKPTNDPHRKLIGSELLRFCAIASMSSDLVAIQDNPSPTDMFAFLRAYTNLDEWLEEQSDLIDDLTTTGELSLEEAVFSLVGVPSTGDITLWARPTPSLIEGRVSSFYLEIPPVPQVV